MSAVFGDFSDASDYDSIIVNEETEQSIIEEKNNERKNDTGGIDKDFAEIKRKIKKMSKQQKKFFKGIKKMGRKSNKKSFLNKLGEVFIQTLPAILTVAVSAVVNKIFGRGIRSNWNLGRVAI